MTPIVALRGRMKEVHKPCDKKTALFYPEVDPESLALMSDYERKVARAQADLDRAAAKELCAACEVRLECLEFSLQAGELDHGIFGGLEAVERTRRMRAASRRLRRDTGQSGKESVIDLVMKLERTQAAEAEAAS